MEIKNKIINASHDSKINQPLIGILLEMDQEMRELQDKIRGIEIVINVLVMFAALILGSLFYYYW